MKTKRPPRKLGYKIGITISFNDDGSYPIFNNGLRQNVLFLYKLFKKSKNCRQVYLIYQNNVTPLLFPDELEIDMLDVIKMDLVIDQVDYVISIGSAISVPLLAALRDRGVRLISYRGGNGAIISMEAMVSFPNTQRAELHFDHGYYDQVWTTPQHMHTNAGWCQTLYRCPVYEVPQIWSPDMLRLAKRDKDFDFGYVPNKLDWAIGVLDPNNTVMKTSHLPMLAIEMFFRNNPTLIRTALIANTLDLKENVHFSSFAKKLTVVQGGKMSFEDRFVGYEFIAKYCDCVVTHNWENSLNYLYYEVLWGGYPLIHNSKFLKEYGYYYESFDAVGGGLALASAFERHDIDLPQYNNSLRRLFLALDPESKLNVDLHERLLFRDSVLTS
jgi:hypothetical protein